MINYDSIGLPHAKSIMVVADGIAFDLALRAIGRIVLRHRFNGSIQLSNADLNDVMQVFGSADYQVSMSVANETLHQFLRDKGYTVKLIDNYTIEIGGWGNDVTL